MLAVCRVCLQIVIKILAYSLVQVSALMSAHVVRLTRIDEEIWLGAVLYTCLYKRERMLRNNNWVVHADYNLQLAFQVLSLVYQTCLLVALRIARVSI